MDDVDFVHCLKTWSRNKDFVLSTLCKNILNRKLLKIRLQAEPFNNLDMQQKTKEVCHLLEITSEECAYFVFTGEAANTMYKTKDEHINILFRNNQVKDISQVDNALIHKTLGAPVKKFYFCYYQ